MIFYTLFDIYALDNDVTVILSVIIIIPTHSDKATIFDSYFGNYYMKI